MLLVALAALGVAAAGGAATVALAMARVTSNLRTVEIAHAPEDDPAPITAYAGAYDVLLVGSDSRDGQGHDLGEGGDVTGARNDVTLLLHVNDTHDAATVISFPRDLIIDVPDCVTDTGDVVPAEANVQLNSTLERGGLACVANAVESLTNIRTSFAAQVSFQGVIDLSSTVGGVPVCFAGPIDDPDAGLHVPEAGTYEIEGEQALSLLRARYGVGDGSDLARISSQQTFLAALARTVQAKATLSNPLELFAIVDALTRNMTLSADLADPRILVSMASALSTLPIENTTFLTYPYQPQGDRVVPDRETADRLLALISAGQVIDLDPSRAGRGAEVQAPASTSPEQNREPGTPAQTGAPAVSVPENVEGQNANEPSCITPN